MYKLQSTQRAQTSAKEKISRGVIITGRKHGTPLLTATVANIHFAEDSFSQRGNIVSWFDLETCSKVVEDDAT